MYSTAILAYSGESSTAKKGGSEEPHLPEISVTPYGRLLFGTSFQTRKPATTMPRI
jgi:hypothetical protein